MPYIVFADATTGQNKRVVDVDPAVADLVTPKTGEQAVVTTDATALNDLVNHYVSAGAQAPRPSFAPGLASSYSVGDIETPDFAGQAFVVTPPPAGRGGHGGPAGADIALTDGDAVTFDAAGTWRFSASGVFPFYDYLQTVSAS